MKILAIRGKNLASLEGEFEIDFTSEPLKSAGIFAITGPTGAGKSTILDALCLALFDNAPRLSKAEQLRIDDETQDNITLKDSRNILRKGSIDGYAEVDFVSLSGEKYRSCWMVRRSRSKAEGVLQNTTIQLSNISTSTEEQGTKRDLLIRITELIGLNFDQFTRAVLLAQGDFATFLKARQNEKAELLEKLTGTEIYSKISSLIYRKTADAKVALELIKQRIADVKLLSDDEFEILRQDKATFTKEVAPLKDQSSGIEKKLNWIKLEEQLISEISKADSDLKDIQTKIREAKPRYEYMAMLDVSQEIRDTYINLENKKSQQTTLSTNILTKDNELKIIENNFVKIVDDLKKAKFNLDDLEQKYERLKPDMVKARELDLQIKTLKIKLDEIKQESEVLQKSEETSKESLKTLQANLDKTKQTKESVEKWFDTNNQFKEIVPRTELIIRLINNAQTANIQAINTTASLKSSEDILKTYTDQLKTYEKEAERLNSLLPTEILNLREKLEDGAPCPVCGSIHHPLHGASNQKNSVNEKILEESKIKITDNIAKVKDNIEATRKSITEFQIHSTSFKTQYTNSIKDLEVYLLNMPDWKYKLEQGVLQNELTSLTSNWNNYKINLDDCNQQIEALSIKIEAENKALSILKEEFRKKAEITVNQNVTLKDYEYGRSLLLKGTSVERIETRYLTVKEEHSKEYEQLRGLKDKTESEKATIIGTLSQLKLDVKANSEQIDTLSNVVEVWLGSNKHEITEDILKKLMLQSRDWINQEKRDLSDIKNRELVTSTTLNERNIRLIKHKEDENKPDENQTKDMLIKQFAEIGNRHESLNKRLTEIQVSLTTHENNKKHKDKFESEYKSKEELYSNWAKLNELLGSATGNKFKTIAQGYTLDVLLSYANKHLEDLTKRYTLEKVSNSLALQVIDNDMLGEVRTVYSLSGGESFLISLSLALGLSSLSSNKMKIESLFIDEGFGLLDIDTLSIAMDALENLQTQGRKIGVISHVEEMKERVTTQIQVIKSSNGKSTVKIVG